MPPSDRLLELLLTSIVRAAVDPAVEVAVYAVPANKVADETEVCKLEPYCLVGILYWHLEKHHRHLAPCCAAEKASIATRGTTTDATCVEKKRRHATLRKAVRSSRAGQASADYNHVNLCWQRW